ncbi:hypothetical protein CF326_g5457 [Tilletia indica]|nr:hypothetical protein CF326_g5457 [Tilletia indica]
MSDSTTQLSVSQGNALVYTTLSAFFLVGLYAGYRCKTERDFFSGIRTQGTFALCLNWIASSQYLSRSHLSSPKNHRQGWHKQMACLAP